MTNISTNLMSALLNNQSIDEFFRSELENAVNELLSNELTAFLDYEKYEYAGRNVNAKYPHAVTYCPMERSGTSRRSCMASLTSSSKLSGSFCDRLFSRDAGLSPVN